MPLPAEVETWKAEMLKAGFVEDDLRPFLARAEQNEGAAKALRGTVMATADYTREMQALKAIEKQEKDELQKTQVWAQELKSWKSGHDAEKKAALEAKVAAESRLNEVQNRIKALKEGGYLGDEDVTGMLPTSTTPTTTPTARPKEGEDDRYLLIEEFNKQAGTFTRGMPKVAARVSKLGRQYDRLFGGTDKAGQYDDEAVIDYVHEQYDKGNKITVDQAVEQMYHFSERQKQLDQQTYDRRVKDEVDKQVSQKISEMTLQGSRPIANAGEEGSPLLKLPPRPEHKDAQGQPIVRPSGPGATYKDSVDRVSRAAAKMAERRAAGQAP